MFKVKFKWLEPKWEVYDKRSGIAVEACFWYSSARARAAELSWKNFQAVHGHGDDEFYVFLVRRRKNGTHRHN